MLACWRFQIAGTRFFAPADCGVTIARIKLILKLLREAWKWLSHVDTVVSIVSWVQAAGPWKLVVSAASGIGGGVWSAFAQPYMPLTILVGLGLFTTVLWTWNGLTWRRDRSMFMQLVEDEDSERPTVEATEQFEKNVQSKTFDGKNILISDLAEDNVLIKDRMFVDCKIVGPGIITFKGCSIRQCIWIGDLESLLIEVPEDDRGYYGIVGFEDCDFRRCKFSKIGIIGTKRLLDAVRSGFGSS